MIARSVSVSALFQASHFVCFHTYLSGSLAEGGSFNDPSCYTVAVRSLLPDGHSAGHGLKFFVSVFFCVPGRGRFSVRLVKSAVCRSVSTGPQSFPWASTGLGHAWRLREARWGRAAGRCWEFTDICIVGISLSGRCWWEFEDMCLVGISLSGGCCWEFEDVCFLGISLRSGRCWKYKDVCLLGIYLSGRCWWEFEDMCFVGISLSGRCWEFEDMCLVGISLSGRCCWEFENMCIVGISLSGRCWELKICA